ncbi:Lar family restriction alleviation protein [Sphingomonas sp. PP-CE-3G-477]|uniref:Lar family restriction alleviation protein n=1 Tax=Sphingomonas sp. PP-CE-3G-477 TaxID=2135660 RepID=UPI000D348241
MAARKRRRTGMVVRISVATARCITCAAMAGAWHELLEPDRGLGSDRIHSEGHPHLRDRPAWRGGGMSGVTLLPCPFCGGSASMMSSSGYPHGSPGAGGTRFVVCDDCYASGPAEPSPRVGTAWNIRTHPASNARQDEGAVV